MKRETFEEVHVVGMIPSKRSSLNHDEISFTGRTGKMRTVVMCSALTVAILSGCAAGLQDCEYRAAQNLRSHTAWWWFPEARCSSNPISDYSCGWRKGYADVLQGGDGQAPPVPPRKYWHHKFQSPEGQCRIDNWFGGYQDGAAAAMASCMADYHQISSSPTYRQFRDACLPSDRAPYATGRTALEYVDHGEEVGYPVHDGMPIAPVPAEGMPLGGISYDELPSVTPQSGTMDRADDVGGLDFNSELSLDEGNDR